MQLRYSKVRAQCARTPLIAAISILALLSAFSIAVVAAAWLLPSGDLLDAAAAYSADAPTELPFHAVDRLFRMLRVSERLGWPDLPIHILGWGEAEPSGRIRFENSHESTSSKLAREAHLLVLEEHGGEWESEIQFRRVNDLARAIASAAGDRPGSYWVTLLNSPQINAFSTADGRIYITRGLATSASDDEIAVAIAHEMHHIRSGHWVNWWQLQDDDSERQIELPVQEDAQEALSALGAWHRHDAVTSYDQELEADAVGAMAAVRCGFAPEAIYSMLTRLPEMPVTSHPSVSQRIQQAATVLHGMKLPEWQAAFDPVSTAIAAVADTLSPEPGGVRAIPAGMEALASECDRVLKQVDRIHFDMVRSRWLGNGRYRESSRLMGRMVHCGAGLAVVDVGVDTGFGRGSVGETAVACGRVWLGRLAGVWTPVLAQTAKGHPRSFAPWLGNRDELMRRGNQANPILKQVARWRDTAVSDFAAHVGTYARGRIEQAVGGEQVQNGALEALGWAQFLSARHSASWPAWDVELAMHSETLATVSFCSAIRVDGLPVASAYVVLTLSQEQGQWKVVMVNWS